MKMPLIKTGNKKTTTTAILRSRGRDVEGKLEETNKATNKSLNKEESGAEGKGREATGGKTSFAGSVSVTGKRSVICCSHIQVLM